MYITSKTHTETRYHFPDLGPDYTTEYEVVTEYVQPESPNERKHLYNTIRGYRADAKNLHELIPKVKILTLNVQQSAFNRDHAIRFAEHEHKQSSSWWYRTFVSPPEREYATVANISSNIDKKYSMMLKTAEYILSVDNQMTFYMPILKTLYEEIITFRDSIKSVNDEIVRLQALESTNDKK